MGWAICPPSSWSVRSHADEDWRAPLHEEVGRLPDRFRLPIVLCYLEGKTHAQAARELHWGEATVRRRLADARDLLRSRLTRRGVAMSSGALAATLAGEATGRGPGRLDRLPGPDCRRTRGDHASGPTGRDVGQERAAWTDPILRDRGRRARRGDAHCPAPRPNIAREGWR